MTKKRIKICHVASVDITVKFLLLPQIKFLVNEGYDVFAVCSDGRWIKDIESQGIRVKVIEIKRRFFTPFSDLLSLIKLFFYFKKEKFYIVHTHGLKSGLLGQFAARLAGVPIIVNTIHGLYFTDQSRRFKKRLFIFLERFSAKNSNLVFSQNKEDIATITREKISLPEKVKYLGNGVDINRFNPEKFSKDFVLTKKKELDLDPKCKIIGTVGRLVKEKGYLDLFEAIKIVLKNHSDIFLLSIGQEEPTKKDRFNRSIIKNYGIESNVLFLGERNDTEELYYLMDIFVLASHREGFPRSVIEAMAMKKPIIVTDIRGCREEIENNKTGIIVPVRNPVKLSQAISFLLENSQKREELSDKARKKAVKEFDEKIVFNRIKEGYKMLVENISYGNQVDY